MAITECSVIKCGTGGNVCDDCTNCKVKVLRANIKYTCALSGHVINPRYAACQFFIARDTSNE